MKIIYLFRSIQRKINDNRRRHELRETERMVNDDVCVGNDPNDPENRIYVFVCGIPIAEVSDVELDGENTILIDHVGEFVANIKKMYLNSLNGKPIQNKQNGNKTD